MNDFLKDRTIQAALIGATAVILAALIGGIFLLRSINTNPTSASPSATSPSVFGSPASSQTTATTSSAGIPSSATCSSTAYGGTCALNDPLTHNSTYHWDEVNNSDGSGCTFKGAAYHLIAVEGGNFIACTASNTNFSNFAYEVKMQFVGGSEAIGVWGGIIFRYGSDGSYYDFIVGITGKYLLEKVSEGVHSDAGVLDQGYADISGSFNTGLGQVNLIGITAEEHSIKLYVNRSPIMTIFDTALSSGRIGVVADVGSGTTSNGNGSTEVAFSNAQVWTF